MSYEHLWGVMGVASHASAEMALPTGLDAMPSRPHLSLVPEPEAYDEFDPFDPETATNEQWQDRALCSQTDPEAFFPEKGGSTREAKKICQRCAVRSECLEYALAHDERFGIWGGLSERERRRLKRGII
ncbi:WhiB family transcriptional regulator [Mycolicibacter hiberniae]|uniref:Transcriptional regulator WhiB n=1 Tax=Mycolicibacter hiberniae TaxID=29314 RepID=A0A7I7X4A6_9MYCO|nr:WhiB family transcriptional regulator [Mycolicibacter hiberniae]ORV71975.1 WhiB [Mycolicibacter hiberniae]BBZ24035.1 transcriptional regulator WhiB2 [Mycolicibacter hiberniae]